MIGVSNVEHRRIWEIDFLRAVAIVLMVVFHFVYDLNEFLGMNIDYLSGFWYWVGKAAALSFIFVSGISSGFSRGTVKRGAKVFGVGMIVTVVTYFFLGDIYIRFGILHLLGICMILFPLLKKINNYVLAAMAGIIVYAEVHLTGIVLNTSLLIPLGIRSRTFATADYYPLVPYLAVFILGILAYKLYYYKKQSLFKFSIENPIITAMSKSSLMIYVLHQPMFIAGIYLYMYFG